MVGRKGYGVGSTPAYTMLDVGVGGHLNVGAPSIEVHLSVENLVDELYRDLLDSQKGFTLGVGRNIGLRVAAPMVFTR